MKILLISGGWSPEREVALNGAKYIEKALKKLGHEVIFFDIQDSFDDLFAFAQKVDVAFINLHGSPGEDGLVQAILDQASCPYQGAGVRGSFLALNKAAAKQLFRNAGLTTPDWIFLPKKPEASSAFYREALPFAYPLFIKSTLGGSSLDMAYVANEEELAPSLEALFAQNKYANFLVEPAITGQELTCAVLEDPRSGELQALPPILIRPKGEAQEGAFFDYHNKYALDGAEEICPAPISEKDTATIQDMALRAHKCLGLLQYSRSDFILQDDGKAFILETNTLPGMTATSLLPKAAKAIGLSFEELIERLLLLAMQRKQKIKG